MRRTLITFAALIFAAASYAQTGLKKVYDEEVNPLAQIDSALVRARTSEKYVVCQVGGNWCPWCLRFADFIARDAEISGIITENFEYIHVNYNPSKAAEPAKAQQAAELMRRLKGCGRFGFPVFVVLDADGTVLHTQDSSFLEEGQGYNKERVLRFFKCWTPAAVKK